jgi:tetratricopeptide (TPR) repeat protein
MGRKTVATVTPEVNLGLTAIGDEKWVSELNATDQVAYRKAKLAWQQAKTAYDTAVAAAQATRDKPKKDVEGDALTQAKAASGKAKGEAVKAQTDLETAFKELDPQSEDQADSARKLTAFQTAADAYKAKVAAVGKTAEDVAAAQDAVDKVEAKKEADRQLAEAQFQLDKATAEIPWNAADNAFQEAVAVFKARKDD